MVAAFKYNLGLKILSVAIAMAIWGFTTASDPIEEWPMQIAVVVSSGKMAVVSRVPDVKTVEAYVRGHASQLQRLQQSNPRAVLDGHDILAGQTRKVIPRLEPAPRGVHAEFVPSSFELTVDDKERVELVPVEVPDGQLPPKYFINSRTGLPASVWVEGAKPLIAKVARVIYNLNLSAITGSTELSVQFIPVDANDKEIRNLSLSPPTADIGISLQPSQTQKTVPIVVDYQGNPAPNHAVTSLSSDPFMVDIAGAPEALEKVKNVHTAAIDLTGKTDSFEQVVNLVAPPGDVNLSGKSAKVSVQISQVSSVTEFADLTIILRGTSDTLDYSYPQEKVVVSVKGAITRALEITPDLIRPVVDVTGLEPGVHMLKIVVELPVGTTLDKVTPEEVEVTITAKAAAPGGTPGGTSGNATGGGAPAKGKGGG